MGRIQNEFKKCYRFEQQDKLGVYSFIYIEMIFIILFLIWKNTVNNIIIIWDCKILLQFHST